MRNIREFFLKNITEKILSFMLAVALYLYVFSEQNPQVERMLKIKLEVKNLPEEMVISSKIPTDVKVKISGFKHVVSVFSPEQIKAYIDLKGVKKGEQETKVILLFPPEIKIKSVEPSTIKIFIDSISSRKVKVVCNKIGLPAENYFIYEPQILPDEVEIKGALNAIAKVKSVLVDVNVSNITSSIERSFSVYAVDENNRIMKDIVFNPQEVSLRLKVVPLVLKEVKVEAQIIGKPPLPYKIKEVLVIPDKIFVKLPEDKTTLIQKVITESINLSNIISNTQIESTISKRDEIVWLSQEKVKVEILVEKQEGDF